MDVDGDGDVDVLSASTADDKIAWYENDGAQNFTAHTITTTADGAQSVYALDGDGDGDIDVLSASIFDDKIAWYENDGAQNFTAHTITIAADGARSVYALDVDGDGDLDVLSASASDDKIAWYENICVGCTAMLSGETTICSGGTANLVVTVTEGISDYTVEIDNNGDMIADIIVNNYMSGANISVTSGATTTYTLLSVIENGDNDVACEVSGTATVTVNNVDAGTVAGDQTICITKIPAPFTEVGMASGDSDITYRWEMSTEGCNGDFEIIDGATDATYALSTPLSETTFFRRVAISTLNDITCEAISNCITVEVKKVDCGAFPWSGNE